MLKRLGFLSIAFLVVALVVSLTAAQGTQATPKIAYINSREIIAQTPGREAIEAHFKKEVAPLEARLKAMADSDAAMLKKYTTDEPTLSADAKASRAKEITDKRQIWVRVRDSLNQVAAEKQSALEKPMAELLKKIISDIRTEEGYWIIFDVADEQRGGLAIVAIDKNMDITQRVLEKYKPAAAALPKPGAAATTPAKGGPVNSSTGVGRTTPPPEP